jgi:hypothetical protein
VHHLFVHPNCCSPETSVVNSIVAHFESNEF